MDGSQVVANAFAKLLADARRKAGMTQEELAHRSGLNRTTVWTAESGKAAPRLDTVIRLAGGLGIEPSDLLPPTRWQPPSASPSPKGRFQPA